MSALVSILLATVVPATPMGANGWLTREANPKTAVDVGHHGPVQYVMDVAPDGKAIRCEPTEKGNLQDQVCEIVLKRARFGPAKDALGQPAYGLYEGVAYIDLNQGVAAIHKPESPKRPERGKLTVTVDSLPEGTTSPAYARVAFAVDASGAISQCATPVEGQRGGGGRTVAALGPAACEKLSALYRPRAARNAAGAPVASVQTAMVRFETGGGAIAP